MPKDHPRDLYDIQHHHTCVPVVKCSYSRIHKEFTLTLLNGSIKVVDLVQLFVLAAPFVFDLENLPLENPDDGQEGRQALRWVKARAQVLTGEKFPSEGRSDSSEAALLPKDNLFLPKVLQDNCFGRITGIKSSEDLKASKDIKLPRNLLLLQRQRQRLLRFIL
ncbi:hypothetical protein E3N88_09742 [Mikania micrantha]|uniref:Uncharacterized protein n=1 Tax=Mikania micrantha TaxID=192012 RepID=A0A5N6PM65_9ASTR|nr:hypothetical protein E3N88_09742 [Mikania micrantha]